VPALGRRPLVVASACLVLLVLAYELAPRDEARVERLLNDSCAELNQTRDEASLGRLRQFLSSALRPEVEVRAPELGQALLGLGAVSTRAEELLSVPPLSFAWSSVETHLSGNRARVDADLWITVRGSGEQHRDLRRSRLTLIKLGESWQIEAVAVDPVAPSEPEARP
jgi:hypothetical protein